MALIRIDHVSAAVRQTLPLNLVLPDPARWVRPLSELPVLFLLHGLSEDAGAWLRNTQIEAYAERLGLVVVAPSGGRSFYSDLPTGQAWFRYLTEELPAWLRNTFRLTFDRDRTFIAGSSMGGYGAMKAALLCPEAFAAAASFSGALSMDIVRYNPDDGRRAEFSLLFGDLDKLPGSDFDPKVWLREADPSRLPRILVTCGLQDELYPFSQQFVGWAREAGVDVSYHEEPGFHDWFFWNRQLARFLAFALPGRASEVET
jgi:S-formylglutathione hydrolase FrmB